MLEQYNIQPPMSFVISEPKAHAYKDRSDLTHVTIAKGVKEIGESCFEGCENLHTIILPDSLETIAPKAFTECRSLTDIIIPKRVKVIDEEVFSGCRNLSFVLLPNGLHSILESAFKTCTNLTQIHLPDTINFIGMCAFSDCRLHHVRLPNNLRYLANYAFESCPLHEVYLPDSLIVADENFCYGPAIPRLHLSTHKDISRVLGFSLKENPISRRGSLQIPRLPESILNRFFRHLPNFDILLNQEFTILFLLSVRRAYKNRKLPNIPIEIAYIILSQCAHDIRPPREAKVSDDRSILKPTQPLPSSWGF